MLCSHCENIDLNNADNGFRHALLDSRQMLKSSEGCEGCRNFLLMAVEHFGKPLGEFNPAPPELQVQLRRYGAEDRRVDLEFLEGEGAPALCGSVGLRLCSAYGMEPLLKATYRRMDELLQGKLVSANFVADGMFLGRMISRGSGDGDCLDVAAGWLERCSRGHEHCSELKDVDLPTRLVHIPRDETQLLRVRDTRGHKGRYVALSHCWGSGIAFQTTQATLKAKHDGFPAALLARNFQDAVRLTRRFGFEYLWIDALCIIQDSRDDWATESSKMAQVYSNASFTISADLAPHSDFGILHPRNIITSHQFGLHKELCLQTRGEGWAAIPYMPLTQRGWTFQERILSSRILHFLQEQIAWECNTTVYLEENYARQNGHWAHFSKNKLTFVLKQPSNRERNRAPLQVVEPSKKADLDDRVVNWDVCVSELAVRRFTKDSDKLPSLSGLASAMEAPEMGKYLAGVWEKNPFLSMAWFPRWPQVPQAQYRAPSWSWAATTGQLMWYRGSERDPTPTEIGAWETWNAGFAPQLLHHHILHATVDPKGEVNEGSHIVVRGFCRPVYIREIPDSRFQEWEWMGKNRRWPGRKVHMDARSGDSNLSRDSTSYFAEDLENIDAAIDRASLKRFTCFQILREKGHDYPKILALILESVSGVEESLRRVGLLVFDDCSKDSEVSGWEDQTLKLI